MDESSAARHDIFAYTAPDTMSLVIYRELLAAGRTMADVIQAHTPPGDACDAAVRLVRSAVAQAMTAVLTPKP